MSAARDNLRERAFHLLVGRVVARFDPVRLLEAWVELGLTMAQLRVLFLLRSEEGAAAGALAERLTVMPSTVTRMVDRLVRQGLVRRETDDGDRRLVRHYLTGTGARTVEEMERLGRARLNEVMDRLTTPQLERLVEALADLAAALEAQEAEEPSRVKA